MSYAFVDNVLYRRSFDQMWLRCLSIAEAQDIVKEFFKSQIVYRFGVPRRVISDNGLQQNARADFEEDVGREQERLHEKLLEALWAYRTTFRTPTQCTLYALVYGSEAVLPLEVQLPSLRIAVANQITTEDNVKQLESLQSKRLEAQQNLELFQARMAQTHDKLVRPRTFKIDDLVLVLRRPILAHRKIGEKFEPTWEGPFVVEK
ncbi:uncharacterized protein LOC110036916, partial [Phalaenopsis equestris]|uniref:uncharacterized protein LOC110036916 n=1 Tax=Phalaenopsis equestris TaxID=78828 RepID=UPI0009E35FA7